MFRGSHYQRTDWKSEYDVIFIGSGLGSLTAASLLSQIGKRVLVLEQHFVLGGFTQTFARKGKFRWDTGVHYVCEAHIENSPTRNGFDWISQGRLQWHETDSHYDRIIVGERQFDYVKGIRNLIVQLKEAFPKESAGIDRYFNLLWEVRQATPGYFMSKVVSNRILSRMPWSSIYSKKRNFEVLAKRSLQDVLDEVTQDTELQAVLAAQCGDYGLPPAEGSFAMHALVTLGYGKGAAFPVGGSDAFVDTIGAVISENGGSLVVKAKVQEILVKDNRAYGVRMEDGREFFTKQVVSGAGVFNTFGSLLPSGVARKNKLDAALSRVERSCAHIALHIGFQGSNSELDLSSRNYWIYPSSDINAGYEAFKKDFSAEFPVVFISFPSAKDPTWEENYPDTATAAMIAFAPFEIFEKWKENKWKQRGEDYDALKASFEKRLLAVFSKHFPKLQPYISYTELSTPLSTRNLVGHEKGEIYGAAFTTQRFSENWMRPKTPVKNLYLTGVDVMTDGITGALGSGYFTALAMEPRKVMGLILKNFARKKSQSFKPVKKIQQYISMFSPKH